MHRIAKKLLASLPLALVLAGCHHEPSLNGDWQVFSAMSPDQPGTISFKNGNFQEDLASATGTGGTESGTYELDGVHLHLTPSGGPGNPKPGDKFSMLAATDFRVEFASDNLGYLIFDSGNAHFELALTRKGEKPDPERIKLVMRDTKPVLSAIPTASGAVSTPAAVSPQAHTASAAASGSSIPLVTPAYTPGQPGYNGPAFTTAVPQTAATAPQPYTQPQRQDPAPRQEPRQEPRPVQETPKPEPVQTNQGDPQEPAHVPNYPGEPPPPPPDPDGH